MSLLEIEIILHYSYSPDDYRDGNFSAPVVRKAIQMFCDNDMLVRNDEQHQQKFSITPKGQFYVEAILNVKMPVEMYRIPE